MIIVGPSAMPVSLSHWGVFELSGTDILWILKSRQEAAYEAKYSLGKKAC